MVVGIIVTVSSVVYHARGEPCYVNLTNSCLGLAMYSSYFVLFLQARARPYALRATLPFRIVRHNGSSRSPRRPPALRALIYPGHLLPLPPASLPVDRLHSFTPVAPRRRLQLFLSHYVYKKTPKTELPPPKNEHCPQPSEAFAQAAEATAMAKPVGQIPKKLE